MESISLVNWPALSVLTQKVAVWNILYFTSFAILLILE